MCNRFIRHIYSLLLILTLVILQGKAVAQPSSSDNEWIRPVDRKDAAVWGIRNGIVVGLWPSTIEVGKRGSDGGPRGLLRIGYEFKGRIYHINYIAIEPVVNGEMEFSEISPSRIDNKWGKFMWAGDNENPGKFHPNALTRGTITHPDPEKPDVEQLSFYIFMEQFLNGAHPYLKVTIRSDRPEEMGLEIFDHEGSAAMERCALTATMGNYARVRLLYLKNQVVDSRELYNEYDDIDFIEKQGYPADRMLTDENGDFIVMAATNETFEELSSWPQREEYYQKWNWRYRPFFKVTQYWRKESDNYDPSLHVRVNGRARYWGGGSRNKRDYVAIPGGPSFENFELREKYYQGQKFYFGMSRKTPEEIIKDFN
jgi:hypothetical protein